MSVEEWTGYEVSDIVLEQAAHWISALDSGSLGDDKQDEFLDWLQQNPSHQQAYLELSELWAKSACIHSMSDMIERSSVVQFPSSSNTIPVGKALSGTTAAPAWAYSVAIGLIFLGLSVPLLEHFF